MASAYKRKFLLHVTRDEAGKRRTERVSRAEATRLRAAGERVEQVEDEAYRTTTRAAAEVD